MEHRAIISKGVYELINQKTAGAQSPDLSLGDRIWHKSDFGASSPNRICKFRIVPANAFYTTIVLAPTI